MPRPMRILFATDFSDASTRAFHEAISMSTAEWRGAHDRSRVPAAEPGLSGGPLSRPLRRVGSPHSRARGSTTAREVLVEAAKERAADLVILGTHGRRGVSRLLTGSVASRVISTASCPVLTVRAA